MVTDKIKIRNKFVKTKKVIKVLLIVFGVLFILLVVFAAGFLIKKPKVEIVLENPLKDIVFANTNEMGEVNESAVVGQGVLEFNEDYINYILVALGVGYLHKSPLFENPWIEFNLGDEVWNSEIVKGMPNSKKGVVENEDLEVSISKEEAVYSLLSNNIEQFMKDSVANGNTQIKMIAGKTKLFSKGYLEMYKELTGEEIEVE